MLQAEQVACGDQGEVVVQPVVAAAFVVAQTEGLFHLAVVGLDVPAVGGAVDKYREGRVREQVCDPGADDLTAVVVVTCTPASCPSDHLHLNVAFQ